MPSRRYEPSRLPAIVHEALRSPGHALDPPVRTELERHLGHAFDHVRVHHDATAAASARAVAASAYTVGADIVFGAGRYDPGRPEGRSLIAHELAHVAQQARSAPRPSVRLAAPTAASEREAARVAARFARSTHSPAAAHAPAVTPASMVRVTAPPGLLQRQAASPGAAPGTGEGVDLIFIIRAPDDQYTADVTTYVKTVLAAHTYREVDDLDEILEVLATFEPRVNAWETLEPGLRVRRIRIVAHGSTTGGVALTPRGESARRWFTPAEVERFARRASVRSTLAQVMAPDAVVEFWGCNLGTVPAAMEAWAGLFGAPFVATTDTFKTGFASYYRPADRGEAGEAVAGARGRWVRVRSTAEIDARGRGLQRHFRTWLLRRYAELVRHGDVLPLPTVAEQVRAMRDLFDRSDGDIKHILVTREADTVDVRPGDTGRWLRLWKTQRP
jgi:hypothetical protein